MKFILNLLTFFLFASLSISAQVLEDQRQMVYGQQSALTLDIDGADSRYVDKEWREFMKDYGRLKKVKKADEYAIEGAQIVDIGGASRVNVYSRIEKTGQESAQLITWFDTGDSYVASDNNPEGYAGAVKLLQKFNDHIKVRKIEDELEESEKEMKKLDSNMSKLQRDNENYHKQIEKAKEQIMKNEKQIVKNIEDQELAQKELEAQAEMLDEVKARLEKARSKGDM